MPAAACFIHSEKPSKNRTLVLYFKKRRFFIKNSAFFAKKILNLILQFYKARSIIKEPSGELWCFYPFSGG